MEVVLIGAADSRMSQPDKCIVGSECSSSGVLLDGTFFGAAEHGEGDLVVRHVVGVFAGRFVSCNAWTMGNCYIVLDLVDLVVTLVLAGLS